ncbi:MAG: peptide chain release factor N(5)-glutamine methyltransferase [Bdellovibrionales bacterium]|nr:peptide chain release factor N(5)-glutamine methyltransferase [Bdellovibrionales bacterium]
MRIDQLREYGRKRLKGVSLSAALDSDLLLGLASGFHREYLLTHPEHCIASEQRELFFHFLTRRCAGEPLAYIRREQEFFGRPFFVSPSVLVPRPETELLVELVLKEAKQRSFPPRILDGGTGSGCIAVSLAQEIECELVVAVEKFEDALAIASLNARRLSPNRNISFIQGNWLDAFGEESFDIIVSNPPYVSRSEDFGREILAEPHHALFASGEGLSDIQVLISSTYKRLANGGVFFCEMGCGQREAIEAELCQSSFCQWYFHQDLSNRDRVFQAVRGN